MRLTFNAMKKLKNKHNNNINKAVSKKKLKKYKQ